MSFWTNFERICKERSTNPTSLIVKKLGLSPSKVTMWKNGSLPKEDMLHRLSDALDCEVHDFFIDKPGTVTVHINKSSRIDPDENYLVELIRTCDFASKHDLMSQCMTFDRNRGLGVIDKIAGRYEKPGTVKVETEFIPAASVVESSPDPDVANVIIRNASDIISREAARGVLGIQKKKKARLLRKPTVTVR